MALRQLVRTEEDLVKKISRSQIIDNWWTAEIMNNSHYFPWRSSRVQIFSYVKDNY